MKKYLKKRVVVLSLAMAAMLALPTMASAQESRSTHGGMFGTEPASKQSPSLLGQSGTRDGNSHFGLGSVGVGGSYWSSTAYDANYAYYVYFIDYDLTADSHSDLLLGFSVRLVRNVN